MPHARDVFLHTTVGKDIAAGTAGGERSAVRADLDRCLERPFFGDTRHPRHPAR